MRNIFLLALMAGCSIQPITDAAPENEDEADTEVNQPDDTEAPDTEEPDTEEPQETEEPQDTEETEEPEPSGWSFTFYNTTGVDLDYTELCFDEERADCVELGAVSADGEASVWLTRFDMDRLAVFGLDESRQQWYTVAAENFYPEDLLEYSLDLEELACGFYEGSEFYIVFHDMAIYPTEASGRRWDSALSWSSADLITGVVDFVVDLASDDPTFDVIGEIVAMLGTSISEVTEGSTPPDAVYHLGIFGEYVDGADTDPSDGFASALWTYHAYDRSEADSTATKDTVFPIFDDPYVVNIVPGRKLYMNAYDVDTVGAERIGGLELRREDLQALADCGTMNNVPGSDLLVAMAVSVESFPSAQ